MTKYSRFNNFFSVPIECGLLDHNVSNAEIKATKEVFYGDYVTVECLNGFTFENGEIDKQIMCLETGYFSYDIGHCCKKKHLFIEICFNSCYINLFNINFVAF